MKRARSSTPASPGLHASGPSTGLGTGERELIAEIRARLGAPPAWLTVGIGDDAAVVEPERGALEILTTDAVVEGIHFDRRVSTPDDIGWKAVENRVAWHDFHATALHLLGIDHTRLTYYHNGIQRRLTNVHGDVVSGILA